MFCRISISSYVNRALRHVVHYEETKREFETNSENLIKIGWKKQMRGNKSFKKMHFTHCVKSVRIRSFSGPYSVRMRENADQKNSEYGHFSRSGHHSTSLWKEILFSEMYSEPCQPLIVSIPVWTSTAKVNTSEEAIILIALLLFLNTYLINVIHGCIWRSA